MTQDIKIVPGGGQRSGLLLPNNVRAQLEEEAKRRQAPPTHFQIPPEMAVKVQEKIPEVEQINALLEGLGPDSDVNTVALMTQPAIRKLLQDHLTGILPQLSQEFCRRDRIALHQVMIQCCEDRKAKTLMKKENIDPVTYTQAVADFYAVISQIPVPSIQLGVTAPQIPEPLRKTTSEAEGTKPTAGETSEGEVA